MFFGVEDGRDKMVDVHFSNWNMHHEKITNHYQGVNPP